MMDQLQSPRGKFALSSRRVILPGGIRQAIVLVDGGKITGVFESAQGAVDHLREELRDVPLQDLGDLILAPGVVDAHVHINEPGRTDWEGFETATKAAAAGGVTTLVDMPLNSSPVTTTVDALETKRQAAKAKCFVDVGFYGGLVPGNAEQIEPLLKAGVLGIKAFLCHSGLDEFPNATLDDLKVAAPILAQYGRPLLVHAELTTVPGLQHETAWKYADYLSTRPPRWENDAIEMLIKLCRETGCHIHIVHLANGDALSMLEAARKEGLPITVETCPHYLFFSADEADSMELVEMVMEMEETGDFKVSNEDAEVMFSVNRVVPDGDTRFKCAPPIRDRRHQEMLWLGLQRKVIDTIGSDHSPCPPEMKHLDTGDFMAAWGGIASLQLTLPLVWNEAVRRKIPLENIFTWLSSNPAKLVGLSDRKGQIAVGLDADLIVFDPEAKWTVEADQLYHRHKVTPYNGEKLQGKVVRTYLAGKLIFREGIILERFAEGFLLRLKGLANGR
ncbi:MAG TPA: amidohydrolase family protein [Pirellulales bacterium]